MPEGTPEPSEERAAGVDGWFDRAGAGPCPVCEAPNMQRYYLLGTPCCTPCLEDIFAALSVFLTRTEATHAERHA